MAEVFNGPQPRATLWWNSGDAFRSRLLDAFSLLLPEGEKFLCDAMKDWMVASEGDPNAPEPLRQEVRRFIREEVGHSRAHGLYNARMAGHSPAVRALEERMAAVMAGMGGLGLPTRIAFMAAFEQLTTLVSREVLREGSAWLGAGDTPQRRLWVWHCQEELAHGQVAVDVLRVAGPGHARYVPVFIASAFFLACDLAVSCARLCWSDVRCGRVGAGRLIAQAAAFAVRALPSMGRIAWGSLLCMAGSGRAG